MSDQWLEWAREYWRELFVGLLGIIFVGTGIFWWRTTHMGTPEIKILSTETETASDVHSKPIKVDIAGAVNKPGVYEVAQTTRVGEVIELAGGITEQADTNWIDKYLNRAEEVKDAQKIYIPQIPNPINSTDNVAVDSTADIKININSANSVELDSLPGVGPVTAEKIVDNRPYSSTEDLLTKKVVSQRVYEQIVNKISAW